MMHGREKSGSAIAATETGEQRRSRVKIVLTEREIIDCRPA
jgi:hypothetical protein